MDVYMKCQNWEMCGEHGGRCDADGNLIKERSCKGCVTYKAYKHGFEDGVQALASQLNSEIEKSKSKIIPDYRDVWKLKEGGQ